MEIDTKLLLPMAEANRNFSKVVRTVDDRGMVVILRNNVPSYIVVGFDEYDEIVEARRKKARENGGDET